MTLWSDSSTLFRNSTSSCEKSSRSATENSGKSFGSGITDSSSSRLNQRIAKPSTSAAARGSASMRAVWACSTAGSCSVPDSAVFISASSGPWLHRKNDSRLASSRSDSGRYGSLPFGGATARYRKSGLESTAVTR